MCLIADLATRGTCAADLQHTSLWWNGPTWLSLQPNAWLHGKHPDITPDVLEQALQEERHSQPVHVSTLATSDTDQTPEVMSPLKMDASQYPTLTRLHRITALCIWFIALVVWTRLSPLTQHSLVLVILSSAMH